MTKRAALFFIVLLACIGRPAWAEESYSTRFGDVEVFHSVVNTTFLEPAVAAQYRITRGKDKAILNLAFREDLPEGGSEARRAQLKGRTWDFIHEQQLEFQEVREGPAIYYIAEFEFINEEWRQFEIYFRTDGDDTTQTLKFRHQLYFN